MPDKQTLQFTQTLQHAMLHARSLQARALQACQLFPIRAFGRRRRSGRSRQGFGTLEVVIIIAVILSIALLFRKTLSAYATNLINTVFAGDPLAS